MFRPERWGCTGIIGGLNDVGFAKRMLTARVPIICTNRTDAFLNPKDPISRLSCVVCDNRLIGQRAADYFLGLKFTHFAFVGQVNSARWSGERQAAFVKRLRQEGFSCEVYSLSSASARKDFGVEQRDLCDWLKRLAKPVAVFAANDVRGRQVLDSCMKANLAVPQEVAVLGVDNDELLCETTRPQMSSIQMNTEQAGFEAARALDEMMRGKQHGKHKQTVITYGFSHLVTRPSTATVLVSDALVARALEFIRINAGVPVKVDDLIKHLHASRRSLETRFKSVMGRTVYAEVMRVRLERVQTLLRETPMTIEVIADTCGFNDASHLGKMFRLHFDMTLSAYRRQTRKDVEQEPPRGSHPKQSRVDSRKRFRRHREPWCSRQPTCCFERNRNAAGRRAGRGKYHFAPYITIPAHHAILPKNPAPSTCKLVLRDCPRRAAHATLFFQNSAALKQSRMIEFWSQMRTGRLLNDIGSAIYESEKVVV